LASMVVHGWSLRLLGRWELRRGAEFFDVGARQQRLLAVLALFGPRPRAYLANLLWPDSSEAHAAGSLRTCVFEVSHRLPGVIVNNAGPVALDEAVDVDVAHLRRLISEIHAHEAPAESVDPIDVLFDADLLPGWYEDWIVYAQEGLAQDRLFALETLAQRHLDDGEADLAIRAAAAAIAIEPLRESAYLLLVRGHLLAGNYASAIRAHDRIRDLLEQELGVAAAPMFDELLAHARPSVRPAPH